MMPFTKEPDPKPVTIACRLKEKQKIALLRKLKKERTTVQEFLEGVVVEKIRK